MIERYRSDVDVVSRYAAFNLHVAEHLHAAQQSASQARESNAMSRARMSLDAARGAGCHPTALAPDPERYSREADVCAVEAITSEWGGDIPAHCDPTHWQRR